MIKIRYILANFIDEFNRSTKKEKIKMVKSFPFPEIKNTKLTAYISATVEELCYKNNIKIPGWTFDKRFYLK